MAGETVPYGGQPGGADDPRQLRISDAERHQVAEILREAAGEGRLDLDELDQRLEATYSARTYADLVPITLDLPSHPHPVPVTRPAASSSLVVPGPDKETHFGIMSGFDRRGVWVVPQQLNVFCFWGGAELDLRQAKFAAQGRETAEMVLALLDGRETSSSVTVPATLVARRSTGPAPR